MEWWQRIKTARERKRFKQAEAAQLTDVDVNTFCRWEKGKSRPRGYNLERLCEVLEVTAADLGLDQAGKADDPPGEVEQTTPLPAFVSSDLTLRLLSLAFESHADFSVIQHKITQIFEEDMNADPTTRRDALRRLAMLPFLTLKPAAFTTPKVRPSEALNQYSASLAACWQLSHSPNGEDLQLAFKGATAYAPLLKALVKGATQPQERKAAAHLASQCEDLRTVLSWHLSGANISITLGQEAVLYGKEAEDVQLQLSALKGLAWAYYYNQRSKEALQSMEQALLLMKQNKATLPDYVSGNILSNLAAMQARHGQGGHASLLQAEKTLSDAGYPIYVDPPVSAFIFNACMALYLRGDHEQAMTMLEQLIDPETLQAKRAPLPERTRIEALNLMALTSLRQPRKDLDQALHFWQPAIEGARAIQSEQRFSETLTAYEILQAVWPGEPQVKALRNLTVHW